MWPRHTGDFSVFRVYAGPDNKPADYSPENKPYKADRFLRISLDGVDENDFAMIMGFPGSTERYMTSYEIDDMLGVSNPNRIFIRGERQAILWEDMLASDKVRIQYASKYARSSNYWKNSIGMSRGKPRGKGRREGGEGARGAPPGQGAAPNAGREEAPPPPRKAPGPRRPGRGRRRALRVLRPPPPAARGASPRGLAGAAGGPRGGASRDGRRADGRLVRGLQPRDRPQGGPSG